MNRSVSASPQGIIRNYYLISSLYTLSASLIWGINTLFLLNAGLNIFQVFLVNAIFSIGMAIFEVPTGVLADARGRRTSFMLSTLVLGAGTLGYVIVARIPGNVLGLAAMSVVMGLGYTFYSGAVEAWLVDALKATGFTGSLDQVFARGSFLSGAAMLAGTVSGGILGDLNLAIPYLLRTAFLLLLFVLAYFMMHDIGYQPKAVTLNAIPREMKLLAQTSLQYGWKEPGLRLLMLVNFIQIGFQYWGFYAWPPYFLNLLGKEAVWVSGVVAALISLATMAGNALVERVTRFCGKRTTLLLWSAVVCTLATVLVGLANSFWLAVLFLLIYMASLGVSAPVRQAYLHALTPSEQRAAIISFDSMIGNGGGIVGQAGLGYLSQVTSIATGYIVGGLATILVVPITLALRQLGEPADRIIGKAGKRSPCAAQGIPSISNVDTSPTT